MDIADDFSGYYAEILDGVYDCVDRLVINAYCPMLHSPGGFRHWWQTLEGSVERLDDAHLMKMAGRFSRRVRGWAKSNGVTVIDCKVGERKHEIAEGYIPQNPDFTGVFLVMVSKYLSPVWHVERFGNAGVSLKKKLSYVNHYSFHIIDPDWGHITIKINGHPPFNAMIILNGHESLEREAHRCGLAVEKDGNCFTGSSDFGTLGRLADTWNASASIGRLSRVCDRWIYSACLCFGLDIADQERSGFCYTYSVFQIEYSRNLLFKQGREMEQIFQRLIDLTRSSLDIRTLKTIFGRKVRPHRKKQGKNPPQFQVAVETPAYDLTIFKVNFGKLTLKIYSKGESVLRIEAVAHDSRELRQGKVIAKLAAMITALRDMAIRFLNILRYAHISFLPQDTLEDLPIPTRRGEKRIPGVDINKPRMRMVMTAMLPLAPKPGGFSVADLSTKVREISGYTESQYGVRQASYDLKKIRGKGLVVKEPRSRRYFVPGEGFQTVNALLILQEKVIKPVLASFGKSRVERKPKNISALDVHYENLQTELRKTFATLGIAA